jgi:ParB/RepB/Spo0J family partition protein
MLMNMNARSMTAGEVPAPEQLQLLPDEPLDLETGYLNLEHFAHEEVPEPTKQLLDSIRRFGLLQPILVRLTMRLVGHSGGGIIEVAHYDIVDGRRRLSCCRILKIDAFPVMIAETDLAIADVATLAANATRTDNPIAEFKAIQRLIRQGASPKDISGATGMSQQTIKKRQSLLRLNPDLVEAFESGKISAAVAQEAAKLPGPVQKELVVGLVANGRITAGDVHEAKLARNQSAVTTSLFDADAYSATNEPTEVPNDDDPVEYLLAEEIRSIIERLPVFAREIDPNLEPALSRAASSLMDIAMMIADAKHMRQGDGDPRYKSDAEIASLPKEKKWNPDHTIFDQKDEGSSVGYAGMRFVDMATDRTEDEGTSVRNPNFVYSVTKFTEEDIAAMEAQYAEAQKRLADDLDIEVKDGMLVEKQKPKRKPRVKKEKESQVETDEDGDFLKEAFEDA